MTRLAGVMIGAVVAAISLTAVTGRSLRVCRSRILCPDYFEAREYAMVGTVIVIEDYLHRGVNKHPLFGVNKNI